jgi:hypothetical protein
MNASLGSIALQTGEKIAPPCKDGCANQGFGTSILA